MLRTVLSFSALLGLLFWALPPASAQHVVSAKAGMIHYAEGKVLLDGQEAKINAKSGNFPSMKNDSVLRTELGRAEVLLAPGMFIRLGEDTTIRMPSTALTDIRVELVEGSVLLEVTEFDKENAVTLRFKNAVISPVRSGLYRLDAEPAELRVFEGRTEVVSADKTLQAKKGQRVTLEGELLASKFDTDNTDTLHRWANRRAGYLAMANIPAARALRDSDARWTTSGWMWNPYFGMYTFIPRNGMLYSPFGYAFYSPRVVYAVYQPRNPGPSAGFGGGGMGGGGPIYNPNLGYSTGSSRSYGGYQGASAGSAPAAAAPAPAPSVRSGDGAAARGQAGGGRSQ